jgi:radical SAM superfamily enzyme YgiQ (UPF0313 family)
VAPHVALIDPLSIMDGHEVTFLRDNFGGEVPLSCPYPPLDLASTAAVLREAGVGVELIAANVLGLRHQQVANHLANTSPTHVLVPSAWGSLRDDFLLMKILRAALPDAKLLISGPNVTAEPEKPLLESDVDYVVLGEPEQVLLQLTTGTAPEDIDNLAYLDQGEVVQNARVLPVDYPNYPLPARDLLDLTLYEIPFCRRKPATTISTTRGCAQKCTFCPTQIWFDRKVRARPVDLVLEEIDQLVLQYGMKEIVFRDDTFTYDRERVMTICEGLIQRGHDLTWRCFGTVDTVDAELLKTMASAGCIQVCYGFESGDDKILAKTGKGTTIAQGRDAVRWTRDAGMEISGTFIVGLEGDTEETVERSIQYAIENDLDYIQVNGAVPMPSTGFGKRQRRQGRSARPEIFRWFGSSTGGTDEIDAVDMPRMVRRFYRRFYLRPSYVLGRLRSQRDMDVLWMHVRLGMQMLKVVSRDWLPRRRSLSDPQESVAHAAFDSER